jgi:hypothetical protein
VSIVRSQHAVKLEINGSDRFFLIKPGDQLVLCSQLTDEERVYLNAAALGDLPIVRQSLGDTNTVSLNVNCVDYMGRSALHLAVDSESMEAVELLLDRINFECIEEALLHAISKGATKIVKVNILLKQRVVVC